MMLLLLIGVTTVLVVTVLAVALCAAAGWGDEQQVEASPLAFLGSLRSQTGKPFFASRRHVGELLAEFEGLRENLRSEPAATPDAAPYPVAPAKETSSTQSRPTPP